MIKTEQRGANCAFSLIHYPYFIRKQKKVKGDEQNFYETVKKSKKLIYRKRRTLEKCTAGKFGEHRKKFDKIFVFLQNFLDVSKF